jgi:hypothetical protein
MEHAAERVTISVNFYKLLPCEVVTAALTCNIVSLRFYVPPLFAGELGDSDRGGVLRPLSYALDLRFLTRAASSSDIFLMFLPGHGENSSVF